MAGGTKLSRLQKKVALNDDTIFYLVDPNEPISSQSQGIEKRDLEKTLNLSNQSTRLISGGMVWVSGLTYESVDLVYSVNGTSFIIPNGTQVTLDVADATNDRIDLIYGDDTGNLGVSKGTPATTPTANTLPSYQLQLKIALILANATEPEGVSIRTVYSENVGQSTEFDATENTSGVRIDLANTTSPLNGSTDIKTILALSDDDSITLTHATPTTFANFDYLKYTIKLLSTWGNDYLLIQLYNGANFVADVNNSLDTSNTTSNQTITLFKNDFNIDASYVEFDTIKIKARVRGASSLQFQLDEIYIGEDSRSQEPVNIISSDVSLDTTNFDNNLDNTITDVQKLADAVDDLQVKVKIGNYWVDKNGNTDRANLEVNDYFEGWATSTRYVVGKVIALPFDIDDNTKVKLAIDNTLF